MRYFSALLVCVLYMPISVSAQQVYYDPAPSVQQNTVQNPAQDNVMVQDIIIEEMAIPDNYRATPDSYHNTPNPATHTPTTYDPAPTGATIAQPEEDITPAHESVTPLPNFEPMKYAILQTLDKVTARTSTVTIPIGKPHAIGPIFAEVKTCQKTPPTEQPESAAFLQIWEAKPKAEQNSDNTESQWVFSGWMFASSPALSAMDHPIYDVWLKDCTNETASSKEK